MLKKMYFTSAFLVAYFVVGSSLVLVTDVFVKQDLEKISRFCESHGLGCKQNSLTTNY